MFANVAFKNIFIFQEVTFRAQKKKKKKKHSEKTSYILGNGIYFRKELTKRENLKLIFLFTFFVC